MWLHELYRQSLRFSSSRNRGASGRNATDSRRRYWRRRKPAALEAKGECGEWEVSFRGQLASIKAQLRHAEKHILRPDFRHSTFIQNSIGAHFTILIEKNYQVRLSGCASVSKTTLSKSKVLGGAKRR